MALMNVYHILLYRHNALFHFKGTCPEFKSMSFHLVSKHSSFRSHVLDFRELMIHLTIAGQYDL